MQKADGKGDADQTSACAKRSPPFRCRQTGLHGLGALGPHTEHVAARDTSTGTAFRACPGPNPRQAIGHSLSP